MQNFSLLYPENCQSKFMILTEEACNDLSLELICQTLSEEIFEQNIIKKIMMKIERNPDIIQYRCDVFEDIMRFPKLREEIKSLLEELAYLKDLEKSVKDATAAPVWQLINRLQELDIYVNCISKINECLTENDIHSDGLKSLKNFVNSIYNESGFEYLQEDIKKLVNEISGVRSVSLGVNLDSRLRPVEVGIVSINDTHFSKPNFLSKFLEFSSKKSEIHNGASFDGMVKIHMSGKVTGEDPLMNNLNRTVTEMLGKTVKQLKDKLSKYVNVSGYTLTKMIPEFIFYIRWADLIDKILEKGIPMTKPKITDTENREFSTKGLYNLKLGLQKVNNKDIDIVLNDIDFNEKQRVFIMTGPNRGGKTTFTQAIGLIFLLAQCGIYVPAESATLSPVDNIYTHFPADENQTVNLGRLGEESKRLSGIFKEATNQSLLLFNESLATTSFAEGLYIAKDVVKALRFLGARTVFNTHMHELACNLDTINTQIEGDSIVVSLITGIHQGRRSYKVYLAPPEGVSYAQDIAQKYGVTFEQLSKTIKINK